MADADAIVDGVYAQLYEARKKERILRAAISALLKRINETWERWDELEAENDSLTRQLDEANETLRLSRVSADSALSFTPGATH